MSRAVVCLHKLFHFNTVWITDDDQGHGSQLTVTGEKNPQEEKQFSAMHARYEAKKTKARSAKNKS